MKHYSCTDCGHKVNEGLARGLAYECPKRLCEGALKVVESEAHKDLNHEKRIRSINKWLQNTKGKVPWDDPKSGWTDKPDPGPRSSS